MRVRWLLTVLAAQGTVFVALALAAYLVAPRMGIPTALLVLALVLLLGSGVSVSTLARGRFPLLGWRLLYPFLSAWGKALGLTRDRVRGKIIAANNLAVVRAWRGKRPRRLLFLLPVCIQNYDCTVKITGNIAHCTSCGKCLVPEIRKLAKANEIHVSVVTGGTEARRQAAAPGLDLILACACERDLLSGIFDSPLPVYGLINDRPEGPCRNTRLDLDELKKALAAFGLRNG